MFEISNVQHQSESKMVKYFAFTENFPCCSQYIRRSKLLVLALAYFAAQLKPSRFDTRWLARSALHAAKHTHRHRAPPLEGLSVYLDFKGVGPTVM